MSIIEIAEFATRPGIDEDTLLAAVRPMNDWLARQPGFVARRLARGEDGRFMDVVEWDDMASAERVMAAFGTEPALYAFAALIERGSVAIRHLRRAA